MLKRLPQFAMLCAAMFSCLVPAATVRADAKSGMKFEVYKDASEEYRWRLKGGDGKVLATGGQGYKAKASATAGVTRMQKDLAKLTFEVYEDKSKESRWRAKVSNGQVVASSTPSYKTKAECEKAIADIKAGAPKAPVSEAK